MLASLRITAQLTLAALSLVLFGVSCAALVTDDLQGNPAIAVLAFVAGVSTLALPGIAFLSYSKPGHWVGSLGFYLGIESLLFVFLTTGLAELTYNQAPKLGHCMSPPRLAPHNFGLVCTLLQTLTGVGWTCFSLLSLLSITSVLLGLRRFWMRDERVLKTPVNELWDRGWNGSWEKQSRRDGFA